MNTLTKGKIMVYLAAIFVAGAAAGTLVGYTTGKDKFIRPPHPSEMADHILKRLQTRLVLTPAQEAKIRPLVEQSCAEMEAIRRESSHRVLEAFKKMNQQIAGHLTSEQKRRLEELEQERREVVRKKCGPRPNGEGSSTHGPPRPE